MADSLTGDPAVNVTGDPPGAGHPALNKRTELFNELFRLLHQSTMQPEIQVMLIDPAGNRC